MQHSQLRRLGEQVKLFAHKNPATVQKTLNIIQLKNGVATDVTPSFTVDELNPGYYSTEIECPREDAYLLVLFCGSPIVLRVGQPDLEFLFWADEDMTIPYSHFDEFGQTVDTGSLDELTLGWYHKDNLSTQLGFMEVFGSPYIISIPYCDASIKVSIQVVWSTRVQTRKFGTEVIKRSFSSDTIKRLFKSNSYINNFTSLLYTQSFSKKTLIRGFKKQCS